MRIIAGTLKGRRLEAPTWDGLRPTSDKLRETLFNVLAPRIPGARVVDAFAGTGALGLEAMSRGASFVAFLEQDRRAQALIARNVAHCGISEGYAMIPASVARGVEVLRANPAFEPFDVILLDPPYDSQPGATAAAEPDETLMRLSTVLAPDGIMVLEHAKRRPAPDSAGPVVLTRRTTAGDSALAYYAWRR